MNIVHNIHEVNGYLSPIIFHKIDTIKNTIKKYNHDYSIEYSDILLLKRINIADLIEILEFHSKHIYSSEDLILFFHENSFISIYFSQDFNCSRITYNIYTSSSENLKEARKKFMDILKDIRIDIDFSLQCNIKWWYHNGMTVNYNYIYETFDDVIYQEAYPYINNLFDLIEEYLDSKENILLLMGPPGTGKTSLIRYIIKKMLERYRLDVDSERDADKYIIGYTTDKGVIESDEIFMDIFRNKVLGLVLEDIDYHLKSREKSESQLINKLLGSSSGFIKNFNKKIFLSTNLDDVGVVDRALIRPGRCFSILKTNFLTFEESIELIKCLDSNKVELASKNFNKDEKYSLAQIYKFVEYEKISRSSRTRKIGF